mmetsp:Transcript_11908/g.36294  ORF Transcript_11908/g.36294 Transcript_11908/m.36294 type:complete len:264 (+) Transcript_11908:72-863(+)
MGPNKVYSMGRGPVQTHTCGYVNVAVGSRSISRRPMVCRAERSRGPSARVWKAMGVVISGLIVAPRMVAASTGQKVAESLRARGIPDELVLSAISALPVVELRGGVPVGFWMQLDPLRIFVCCVLGNLLPVVPLLLALRSAAVRRVLGRAIDRANKIARSFGDDRKRLIALSLFVGVPFPGTGAWTGTMVAYVLGIPVASAFASIAVGVLLSGIIMSALCMLGLKGAVAAGCVMLVLGFAAIVRGPPPGEQPREAEAAPPSDV